MEQATTQPASWSDVLLRGVSGYIDSQIAKNYLANDPSYNTAGGVGGQAQVTPVTVAASPAIWVIGAALVGVVIFLSLKR